MKVCLKSGNFTMSKLEFFKPDFFKKNKFAGASLLLFIGVYVVVFIMNMSNILEFGASFEEAANLTSYADTNVTLIYNDILCQNIRRIEMEGLQEAEAKAYFDECIFTLKETYTGNFISCSIIVAFALVLLSVIFYYGGILSELYLSEPKTVESFDYLDEIDDRYKNGEFDGPYYYDVQTNQLIIGEDAYEAKVMPNDNYIGGAKRVALIAGEVVILLLISIVLGLIWKG